MNDLTFHPLHWIYHDCWWWEYRIDNWYVPDTIVRKHHPGHIHFFMPSFSIMPLTTYQAYSGIQKYDFNLRDTWSANSLDPNQQNNVRIVGKPKWYFYISEYWRRIYLQQWDYPDNTNLNSDTNIVGKKGIKYDASKPQHTRGPFREGKDNLFFTTELRRTLPIEYWRDENKKIRDHLLRYGDGVDPKKSLTWDFDNDYPKRNETPYTTHIWENYYDEWDEWTIPRNSYCRGGGHDNDQHRLSDEDNARRNYPDRNYMSPTIEYQRVVHKNWERLDGWEERDVDDEMNGTDFGDGFQLSIEIPYKLDDKIQSPFSDDLGVVHPPPAYFHGCVKDEDKLKYRNEYWNEYETEPTTFLNPTQELMNTVADFEGTIPNSGWNKDGVWIEQCLGAMVQAKCKVVLLDNFGGRRVVWIRNQKFKVNQAFVGKDNGDEFPS